MAKKVTKNFTKKDVRFLLKPPEPGELQVFIDIGKNTRLPADLRKALERFLKELDAVASNAKPEGFLGGCQGDCKKNSICFGNKTAASQLVF